MRNRAGKLFLNLAVALALSSAGQAAQRNCSTVFASSPSERVQTRRSPKLERLTELSNRFAPLSQSPSGPHVRMLIGVIEVGKMQGLTTTDGKTLNQSLGGIGTVMNDTWAVKAPLLLDRGIETIAVTPLMRNVSHEGLTRVGGFDVEVDGHPWPIQVFEFKMQNGGRVLFLENENFTRRFDAIPRPGFNIYEMYDLPWGQDGELEKQRIWSALSQATAKVYALIGADAYTPQDGHLAPASYYIHRAGHEALTLAPVLHNERYLDSYTVEDHEREQVARIWNVSETDLDEYFGHDDEIVVMAPAIRTAERSGVFTGKSVSNNTAHILNRDGLPDVDGLVPIELFSRIAAEENFLANSNRPDVHLGLAQTTASELADEHITDSEIVQIYESPGGYQFGGQHLVGINAGKARAKRAIQKLYGFDVDVKKPLYVSFARLVEQKGLDFLVPNVVRILRGGGQIIVGGPVGDEEGARTQAKFKALKTKLTLSHPELSRNFAVIEGSVTGRRKALLLAAQDFFPLPSRYEPCGLTDVEALYMGGQPIAPRLGGLVKGHTTIKYKPENPEDQSGDLGLAIDRSMRLFYKQHAVFLRRQIAANGEDFSLEKNVDQALQNQRIEIAYRILGELDRQVATKRMSLSDARTYFRRNWFDRNLGDRAYFLASMKSVRPNERSPMMNWILHLPSEIMVKIERGSH